MGFGNRAATIEAACLAATGAGLLVTETTLSAHLRRLRNHPAGLLLLAAAAGALLAHILLEGD